MKILMINKFLFPNGGSETYIFKLGAELIRQGHEVQYFGMEHEGNIVGNHVNAYTTNMDFHNGSFFSKLTYPVKTIYSREARKKIRMVLDDFMPDACHLNNFNYQLTPSIILEIKKWTKESGHKCKIVYTAHDYQLICPNHMCRNNCTNVNCERCLKGNYTYCVKNKCIHGSVLKSLIGMIEAYLWRYLKVYRSIDEIVCCSEFMNSKMKNNPIFRNKTLTIHNFVEKTKVDDATKKRYVLYFGRYNKEKGLITLVNVCKKLPQIPFVFAGSGPLERLLDDVPNIVNVGFKSGDELSKIIAEASFTVYPSEWYENCPFSVMESIMLGTPVLGADIGGIPELINDGEGMLFISGNEIDLKNKILKMWDRYQITSDIKKEIVASRFDDVESYARKIIMDVYPG